LADWAAAGFFLTTFLAGCERRMVGKEEGAKDGVIERERRTGLTPVSHYINPALDQAIWLCIIFLSGSFSAVMFSGKE
jgi:hypothetical protein